MERDSAGKGRANVAIGGKLERAPGRGRVCDTSSLCSAFCRTMAAWFGSATCRAELVRLRGKLRTPG